MKKTPKIWIIDIINATESIDRLLIGFNFDQFKNDERTNLAITKLIENVGEACNHLVDDFQDEYKQIPWRKVIAMRNQLAHQYWDIDYKIVWEVATKQVHELKQDLLPILQDLEAQESKGQE